MKHTEEIIVKIAEQLKALRLEKGLSHEKLAQLAGISRGGLSLIESHQRTPSMTVCLKICAALDVKLSDMLKDVDG